MFNEELKNLLDRVLKGTATEEEKEEAERWYQRLDKLSKREIPDEYLDPQSGYEERMLAQFKALHTGKRRIRWILPFIKVAAIAVLLVSIGTVAYYMFKGTLFSNKKQLQAIVYNGGTNNDNANSSRYLRLPDGSVVILHAGSTLKMYDSSFGSNTREVVLNGEAYFDIQHLPDKPFIIHTGNLKVTVLGTAFNVKENGDSIAVTVTRGKVKVEDTHKVIAILTPNQQVVYNSRQSAATNINNVAVKPVMQWMAQDMQFDNATFENVAKILQQRYQVSISFDNPGIENCKITITDAFDGTETLDKVLNVICSTFNCTFTHTGNDVVINGAGCPAS